MADWVDIDNETIEPDAPLISSTMFALRDNPQAIAEGAAGAPRITNEAMADKSIAIEKAAAVEAGNVVRFRGPDVSNGDNDNYDNDVISERLLNSGTLRVTFKMTAANGGTAFARVLVNNTVVEEISTSTQNTLIDYEIDCAFNQGDRIRLQVKGSGAGSGSAGFTDDTRLRTSGGGLWPAPDGYVY